MNHSDQPAIDPLLQRHLQEGEQSLERIREHLEKHGCELDYSEESLVCLWKWYIDIIESRERFHFEGLPLPFWYNSTTNTYNNIVDLSGIKEEAIYCIPGIAHYLAQVLEKNAKEIYWEVFNPPGGYYNRAFIGMPALEKFPDKKNPVIGIINATGQHIEKIGPAVLQKKERLLIMYYSYLANKVSEPKRGQLEKKIQLILDSYK